MPLDTHITSNQRRHFADRHMLLKTSYSNTSTHICDICRSRLEGLVGYRCNACDFNIHEACANCFKETINFFAHPWHALTLSRLPDSCVGWVCSLCREQCQIGSFVYRCIQCEFDAHPFCTLLPQTIHSPLHQDHNLHMVPESAGKYCSVCHEGLPVWNYCCGFCQFRLHIACVSATPSGEGQQRRIKTRTGPTEGLYGSAPTSIKTNNSEWSRRLHARVPTPTQRSRLSVSTPIRRRDTPTLGTVKGSATHPCPQASVMCSQSFVVPSSFFSREEKKDERGGGREEGYRGAGEEKDVGGEEECKEEGEDEDRDRGAEEEKNIEEEEDEEDEGGGGGGKEEDEDGEGEKGQQEEEEEEEDRGCEEEYEECGDGDQENDEDGGGNLGGRVEDEDGGEGGEEDNKEEEEYGTYEECGGEEDGEQGDRDEEEKKDRGGEKVDNEQKKRDEEEDGQGRDGEQGEGEREGQDGGGYEEWRAKYNDECGEEIYIRGCEKWGGGDKNGEKETSEKNRGGYVECREESKEENRGQKEEKDGEGCKEWEEGEECSEEEKREDDGGKQGEWIGAGGGEEEDEEEDDKGEGDKIDNEEQPSLYSNKSRHTTIAKFILRTTGRFAIDAVTGGLASPVLDIILEVGEEPFRTAFELATGTTDNDNNTDINNNNINNNQSRGKTIGKSLMKTTARVAANIATGGLASPVLDILEATF